MSDVGNIIEKLGLSVFSAADKTRSVTGGYCGDLLSWVMGRAQADEAWITIMSNANIVAVASLTDVACMILAEGVTPDAGVAELAGEKGVTLLGSEKSAFTLSSELSKLL